MKSALQEFKMNLERDYLLRRYQKLVNGQIPFEDRLRENATKTYVQFITSWRIFVKRAFDIAFSLTSIILGAPVIAVIALAVKLSSPGPVIYSQTRVGQKGKLFQIYKFRSMRQDAESQCGPVWAKENDPRVTPLGEFLRKSHLDELPQLFNVLKGEMSVVGPRPERPHFVKELRKQIPHYDKRHFAKPGITGLAQIKRRYDDSIEDVKKKVRYDVLYIKKMCPFLDVKVVALTAFTVILRTGR